MNLNIDWSKDFQEFQEILNSGIHPEWLYCAKANLVFRACLYWRRQTIFQHSRYY